jgi:hypothetical protein
MSVRTTHPLTHRFCLSLVTLASTTLAGCAGNGAQPMSSGSPDTYRIPVTYSGVGVGPNPNTHAVVLQDGQAFPAVRQALAIALQKRDCSLDDDAAGAGLFTSDTAPLSRTEIEKYNDAVTREGKSQFCLPNDRQYGIGYQVKCAVNRDELELRIAALLKNRGAGNPDWKALGAGRDYESLYFTRPLSQDIQQALIDASHPRMPTP